VPGIARARTPHRADVRATCCNHTASVMPSGVTAWWRVPAGIKRQSSGTGLQCTGLQCTGLRQSARASPSTTHRALAWSCMAACRAGDCLRRGIAFAAFVPERDVAVVVDRDRAPRSRELHRDPPRVQHRALDHGGELCAFLTQELVAGRGLDAVEVGAGSLEATSAAPRGHARKAQQSQGFQEVAPRARDQARQRLQAMASAPENKRTQADAKRTRNSHAMTIPHGQDDGAGDHRTSRSRRRAKRSDGYFGCWRWHQTRRSAPPQKSNPPQIQE
jgi:hypothetical protein